MKPNRRTDTRIPESRFSRDPASFFDYLARYSRVVFLASLPVYLGGLFGKHHWLADLCANFVPQLAALTCVCTLIFAFARWPRWIVGGIALLLIESAILGPYFVADGLRVEAIERSNKVRILQFNVSSRNSEWQSFLDWLRPRMDAIDVIVLLENTPSWTPVIHTLKNEFPAYLEIKRTDSYGIAVFSRLHGSALEQRILGPNSLPAVELRARLGMRTFTLIAAHTSAPLGRTASELRNLQLQELGRWVMNAPPGHKVLLGDLNLTPFSPWFGHLLGSTELSDAQYGLGLLPTWAPGAIPTELGLPIDHTLVSNDFTVVSRGCAERFGSDHCPVTTDLIGTPRADRNGGWANSYYR